MMLMAGFSRIHEKPKNRSCRQLFEQTKVKTKMNKLLIIATLLGVCFAADYANTVLRNTGAGCTGSIALGASILSGSCFVTKSTCDATKVTSEVFNNGADLFSCTGTPLVSVSVATGCLADSVEISCGPLPVQNDLIYISTYLDQSNNCVGDPDVVAYVPSGCAPLLGGLVFQNSSIPNIFRKITLTGDVLEASFPCSDDKCTSCGSTTSFKLGDCTSAASAPGQPALNTRYSVGFNSAASSIVPAIALFAVGVVALFF
jgi:hypothetical protein